MDASLCEARERRNFGLSAFLSRRGYGVQRALVVSIHDVAPSTRSRVEKILADLAQHQIDACSLLVVPDYHRQGRSLADPGFRSWLEEMNASGHEIVLHGFFHQRARKPDETAREKIVTRFYTADEGEFFDLGYADALRLIREARHDFETHGFHLTDSSRPPGCWARRRSAPRSMPA